MRLGSIQRARAVYDLEDTNFEEVGNGYAAGWLRNRRSNRSPLSETYYLQRTVIPAPIPKKEKGRAELLL